MTEFSDMAELLPKGEAFEPLLRSYFTPQHDNDFAYPRQIEVWSDHVGNLFPDRSPESRRATAIKIIETTNMLRGAEYTHFLEGGFTFQGRVDGYPFEITDTDLFREAE